VNDGSQSPSRGEWTRLVTPERRFNRSDGGCLKFDYRSRFMDLNVYLLMTSHSSSHLVDIHHDGQVCL